MKITLAKYLSRVFLVCTIVALMVASLTQITTVFAAPGDGASSNIQLFDTDGNGIIDQITFDIANPNLETWSLNGAMPHGLSVTQNSTPVTITGVSITSATNANPVTVQVDLNEAGMLTDTDGVNTNAIELIYTQAGYGVTPNIQDNVDEELNAIATGDTGATDTEIDAAAPIIIGLEYYDNGSNGSVETIDVDFSETVSWNYNSPNQFLISNNNLTGLDDDGEPDNASGSGTSTITLTTSGTTDLTGVGTGTEPTTDYQPAATSADRIKDAAGNDTVAMATTTITDGADPALLAFDYEDLNGDGTVDNIYLQFTEDIDDDVAGMSSSDFSVTISGATTGQGGAEMVETLNVGTFDDDEIDIAFTNGLTFNTSDNYEISVGPNKIGDANANYLPTLNNFPCADEAAPIFASVDPTTGSYQNDTKVSYSLSETLVGGYITWTRTSGTADAGSPHTATLVGAELSAGTHTDITLTNNPTLVDGTVYTVSFNGGDGFNPATPVNSTNVTYDTTSPTPTVTVDTDPIYEGDLTQQVTVTYDEPMDTSTKPVITMGGANWGAQTDVGLPGAWSAGDTIYTATFTHDGTGENTLPETITVGAGSGATDLAGNADNAGSASFAVDTIDPVPTFTSFLPPYSTGTHTITFTANDTGTGVASTTCSVDGSTFTLCSSGDTLSTLGGWGGLADGPFTVTLRVTDNAGNTADATDSACSKDTTAPVTTITGSPTPTNGTQTFTFTATDATSGVVLTTCAVDGVTFGPCNTGDTYSSISGWGALPEGAFTLTVRTTDNVGLTHEDTAPVTKDTIPPAAPAAPDMQAASDSGTSNSDNLTNDTTPTFDVVASEAGSTMDLFSDVDGLIGTRTGSGAITAPALSEGTHGITVVETDTAGNGSVTSSALGIVIDTTSPSLAETTPVPDPTNDQTPDVSFSSDETGAISWGGGCDSTTTMAAAATQTITLDSDGAGGDLAEATYNCTLTVTDGAGNPGSTLALTAFTADTSIPTGTATVGTDPLYEGDLIQEVTITYDEAMDPASTPTINFTGTTGTFTSNADGGWSTATTWDETFTMTDANEEVTGATAYSSGATDIAGNPEGAPVNATFDVDTLAPTLTTVTIASDNITDTTTAGVGNDITLTIFASETINQPVVAYTSGGDAVTNTPFNFPAWFEHYIADVADTEGVVAYTIDFTDLAGNNGTQVTTTTDGSSVNYDNSAPTVMTYSPADDATGIAISSNLDLTFDDNITAGVGNVVIYKAADDSVVETIDITTPSATFDGTTGVSINPAANFAYSTAYYVQIDATAIENTVGLAYAGIADKTTWNFTTAAAPTPPSSGGGGGSAGGRVSSPTTTDEEDETGGEEFSDVEGHWAEDYVYEAKDGGYIEGYEDETFKPDQYIARSEAAKLIAMWLDANIGDDVCQDGIFSDVDCSLWYAKYVSYLSDTGIIDGYEDGTFGPALYINRAEALKMMLFAKALQDSDIADVINPFSDINMDQWFYNYVMIGYKLSIIQGYEDGTFGPGNNITRAEFTKIFVETLLNN